MTGHGAIAAASDLSAEMAAALDEYGFFVLPGAVPAEQLERLDYAYDEAMAAAAADDKRVGSTTTRVSDFVNRGAEFDSIYIFPQLSDPKTALLASCPVRIAGLARRIFGHGANLSERPRRSLQGAFIPRDGCAANDFSARMQPATRARLSALALHVLVV